jgi:hypothetical protein
MTGDYARLQALLDLIGTTPGAILVRGPDKWIALLPGTEGYVLAVGAGGLPEWTDPTTITWSP